MASLSISRPSCCQESMNGAHCPTHAPPRAPEQPSPTQIQPTGLGHEAEGSLRPSVQGYCFWVQAFTVNPALVPSLLAFNLGLTLIRKEQGSWMVCIRDHHVSLYKSSFWELSGCNSSFSCISCWGLSTTGNQFSTVYHPSGRAWADENSDAIMLESFFYTLWWPRVAYKIVCWRWRI